MALASSSFQSVIRGVSQQPAHKRIPGQQGAQDNMVSDPVEGLSRRLGSVMKHELDITSLVPEVTEDVVADARAFRDYPLSVLGRKLSLLARAGAAASNLPGLVLVDKAAGVLRLPITDPADDKVADILTNGVSAATSVGRFILFAGDADFPEFTETDRVASTSTQSAAWVKGGSFSRTYKVRAKLSATYDEDIVEFSYKTMDAAFGGSLITDDIPVVVPHPDGGTTTREETHVITSSLTYTGVRAEFFTANVFVKQIVPGTDPTWTDVSPAAPSASGEYSVAEGVYTFHSSDIGKSVRVKYSHERVQNNDQYQALVNDRTSAYNTAVNQHLKDATADIQPESIAEKLRAGLDAAAVALGHPAGLFLRAGSHVYSDEVTEIVVDDGGDGTFLRGVAQVVQSPERLTDQHFFGKVVRVTPRDGAGAISYYMQADAKLGGSGVFGEVVWRECAGTEVTPTFICGVGVLIGDDFFIASTPELLSDLAGIDVPELVPSAAGDKETSPVPAFFGKRISHMLTMKDRLAIVSGAVVSCSRTGDYFNFFRASALTVLPNDPAEQFALGSEDDVIRGSALLDGSVLLFGDRGQYAINAREPITPQTFNIFGGGSMQGSAELEPQSGSGVVFFAQRRDDRLVVQQFRSGAFEGSLEPQDVTRQLNTYLSGRGLQLLAQTAPDTLVVRTTGLPNGLFMFLYIDDSREGRLLDSWSRWTWAQEMGDCVCLSDFDGAILATFVRSASDRVWLVLDEFTRSVGTLDAPLLDSRRPFSEDIGSLEGTDSAVVIGDPEHRGFLVGRDLSEADVLLESYPDAADALVVGLQFQSEVELTPPFKLDRNGRPILDSQLVLTQYAVTLSQSCAIRAFVSAFGATSMVLDWIYRPLSNWQLGTQPIAGTAQVPVPVLREVREHTTVLRSRAWLPMTITAIEWQGQFFTARR